MRRRLAVGVAVVMSAGCSAWPLRIGETAPPPAHPPASAPASASASAPVSALPSGCDSPDYHRLDFWLGTWDVKTPHGDPRGTDALERIDGGCAIQERWTDADGHAGTSLFYFNRVTRAWRQVSVTDAGGTKEKTERAGAVAGAARFEGEVPSERGGVARDRTTLTVIEGGGVRQVVEQSTDGGKTWTSWEAIYTRASRPALDAGSGPNG